LNLKSFPHIDTPDSSERLPLPSNPYFDYSYLFSSLPAHFHIPPDFVPAPETEIQVPDFSL
jgi:hypothetical protein